MYLRHLACTRRDKTASWRRRFHLASGYEDRASVYMHPGGHQAKPVTRQICIFTGARRWSVLSLTSTSPSPDFRPDRDDSDI